MLLLPTCCSKIEEKTKAKTSQYLYIQRDDNIDLPDRIVNPDVYQHFQQQTLDRGIYKVTVNLRVV